MLVTVLAACAAMLVNDVLGTCLVLAQSKRQHKAAGHLDGMSDYTKVFLYAGAGVNLLHGHGWMGYLAMLPVAVTGDLTTRFSTKYGDRLVERFGKDVVKEAVAIAVADGALPAGSPPV